MLHIITYCNSYKIKYEFTKNEKTSFNIICDECGSLLTSISPINGYVYILSNPCMPNLVKIGYTTRSVFERINELNSSSGVPEQFIIEASFNSEAPEKDEQYVHLMLNERRTNQNREFFSLEPVEAVDSVQKILGRNPDYIGKRGSIIKDIRKKEHEMLLIEEQRKILHSKGIYTEDPGQWLASYSFFCKDCEKRFYSRCPQSLETVCPNCFSSNFR